MALQVPARYLPAFGKLRALPGAAFEELIEALMNAHITSRAEAMTAQIAEHVKSVPIEDLTAIVDLVYSLYHVREYSDIPKDLFLRELVDGLKRDCKPPIADSELGELRARLMRMLNITALDSLSKAINVQRAVERFYCGARILSDIRSVFGEDPKAEPVAAVITHTLELGYHEGGSHKEFYLSLDGEDLKTLLQAIQRAQAKTETLENLLNRMKLPRLGA